VLVLFNFEVPFRPKKPEFDYIHKNSLFPIIVLLDVLAYSRHLIVALLRITLMRTTILRKNYGNKAEELHNISTIFDMAL
jgi:hypothetical protein